MVLPPSWYTLRMSVGEGRPALGSPQGIAGSALPLQPAAQASSTGLCMLLGAILCAASRPKPGLLPTQSAVSSPGTPGRASLGSGNCGQDRWEVTSLLRNLPAPSLRLWPGMFTAGVTPPCWAPRSCAQDTTARLL